MKHYYHYISEENELLNDLLFYINSYTSLFGPYYKEYKKDYYLLTMVSDKNILNSIRQWKKHPNNWVELKSLIEIELLNDFLSILNERIEYLNIKEEIKNTIKFKITKIIENENQLQGEENSQSGRNLEQGCRVCSRRNQIKIAVGHLSNETRFANFGKHVTRAENNLSFSSRQVF